MTSHVHRIAVRYLGAVLLGVALGQPDAYAAGGSYRGTIDMDSGLGLVGQTMRVDFVYDENTMPSDSSTNYALFDGFLTSMTITIGPSTWNWSAGGYASVFLYNNALLNFSTGLEDRVSAFADTFNGPSLIAQPVDPQAYSFDLGLNDNGPSGNPDGLAAHATLPSTAPNPDLFRIGGVNENRMSFRFYTGNPETGDRYAINAIDVTPVPEPSTVLMLLVGVGMVGGVAIRRSARRP